MIEGNCCIGEDYSLRSWFHMLPESQCRSGLLRITLFSFPCTFESKLSSASENEKKAPYQVPLHLSAEHGEKNFEHPNTIFSPLEKNQDKGSYSEIKLNQS